MIIAADHNIPDIAQRCAGMGEVRLYDSRDAGGLRALLREAEVLLCRSTIRVDAELLGGTPVRFVATATAGTDHFDTTWLEAQGIAYASAAGSNARSVAEWWGAAMLELQARGRLSIPGATVGIVGVGHVGIEVADVARALGMTCLYNDPPRQRRGEMPVRWSADGFSKMEEILRCDVVTLHVPLTQEGEFSTAGFFGAAEFGCMRPGSVFVNAARGGVMDPAAVRAWSEAGNPVVLDVFPGEPRIDPALVRISAIATPHIAGHAWDGKLRGTEMVVEELAAWIEAGTEEAEGTKAEGRRSESAEGGRRSASGGQKAEAVLGPARSSARSKPEADEGRSARSKPEADEGRIARSEPEDGIVRVNSREEMYSQVLDTVRGVYDIRIDDAALRRAMEMGREEAAAEFARLRAEYPVRREFASCEFDGAGLSTDAAAMLCELGLTLR